MKKIIALITTCWVLNSCNRIAEVGINSLGFGNEVSLLQNLTFEFDKDLVFDGDLNHWESTPYIEFEPKIPGKFKWIGKKELVFSPSRPLRFANEYKAKLSTNLLKRQKGKLEIDKNYVFSFHTPYLKINESSIFFAKNKENQKEARILLELNGKYDSHNINQEVEVKQDNKPLEYNILPSENSNNLILALKNTPNTLDDISIKIASNPEISAKFKDNINLDLEPQTVDNLEITKVETSFKKLKGYIKVKTNQQIDLSILDKKIKITPALKISIESSDQGFIIKGDFNQEDVYKLKIDKSTTIGVLGGKMDNDYETDLFFGKVNPYLEFTNKKAQYISNLGNRNIGINIVNIPKIAVIISKVFENNILPFLKGNRRESYEDEEGGYSFSGDESLYSNDILNKEIETENLPRKQGVAILNMPLPDQSGQKGIYFVSVRSTDEYYQSIQKIVSLSDIGLIAKMSLNKEDLIVFANSIMTTEALKNIEIKLVSSNNQEIAKEKTNKEGIVVFKNIKTKNPTFEVAMLTATNGNDFNYLLFEDTIIETSKFDLAGKNNNEANIDAFIYGDRDIYRPGETVNLNTIVRTDTWKTSGDLPIKIIVKQPNGKIYYSLVSKTNENGAVSNSFKLERSALTGFYNVDVLTGNDILIGSKTISVEDFMPDRIKVNLEGPSNAKIGEKISLKIVATNLFGPPANDKKYEMEYAIKRKTFAPVGFQGFDFGLVDETKYEKEQRNGLTNEKGEATQVFEIPNEFKNRGLLEGKFLVSVFDETGRPVHRLKTVEISTQSQYYGIKLPNYFTGTNMPISLDYVSLNIDGKHVNSKALVEIYLLDYQTVLEKTEEGLKYVSKKKETLIKKDEMTFSGKVLEQIFTPKISGEYEIRIKEQGSNAYVNSNFYAYGYGNKASFEVDTDGEIQIETNKTNYAVGDKATAIFKTPFDGKLLITIENNGILEHRYIQTQNKSSQIEFNITEENLPNVFITATLIRAMNQPELPLMSAHGIANLKVDDTQRIIPIDIVSNEKSRSKSHQKISVKTLPNTELTIAVVDEGILQLKNTETPKIFEYFYQKRAAGVSTFDLYPLLLPEIQLNSKSSTGGDGAMAKRINPLANGRAELVAKWSGQLHSDANGNVSFEIDIPEFLGSLRIMAVAYKGEKFGSADKKMTVSDPISISIGLPAFLSPNDNVKVPVTFFNTTEKVQNIDISGSTDGQIKLEGIAINNIILEPGKERTIELNLIGLDKIGLGNLKIMAKSEEEVFSKSTQISVRPAGSLHKSAESGMLIKDKDLVVKPSLNYIPSTYNYRVYISNSPQMKFGNRLEDLLNYPHGCLEQTISKAFPQLYLDKLIEEIGSNKIISESGKSENNPQFNVNEAIRKLESMQMYNGAMTYWPGTNVDYWWGSAYALHFFLEAKKNGFEVSEKVIKDLEYYLNTKLTSGEEGKSEVETLWSKSKGSWVKMERIKSEYVYSLYVLSLTDDPNLTQMNLFKTNIAKLSNDQKFLLACAYKQIGDDATFNNILPKTFLQSDYERLLGEGLDSPIRSMSLVLNTLIETDPTNKLILSLSQSLNEVLSNKKNYLNTQELSFSMLAMGKLLKKSQTKGKSQIFENGKLVKTIENKGEWVDLSSYVNGITIKTTNDNMYFYFESEGILKTNNFIAEDKFLKVRRAYYTREGNLIKTPNFKLNQLVVVRLSLSTLAGLSFDVDNVVMTDMLPAGFEIENPRLVEDREMTWIKNASNPDYFDIRDDRINYFIDAENKEKNYYYLARAVTKGSFIQGPASADAMYNGNYRSYWGAGRVIIN